VDLVFGDGAFETAEETEEVGPAVGFGGSEARTAFAGFFAAEVLELLVDPGAVEFRGEELKVVEDIGREIEVLVSGGSAVADKLFGPYKHSCSDVVVEHGAINVRLYYLKRREGYFESGGVLRAFMYCSVKFGVSRGLTMTSLGKWVSRSNNSSFVLANPIFDTSRKY